jgi:hypothetical protein
MTVESEVANLTTAVDNLTSSVNVKKATLDASVANAQGAQTGAQDARDTANLHKLAAEAAATSATSTAAALTGFDLEAIAETKGVTAVDVFVYDTSKDSDGGAWRKRTQGTSWYNETLNTATRGSRREFPAVAVIVAEAGKVTIYDGDDSSLPMWMVFDGTSSANDLIRFGPSAVTAFNGLLNIGLNGTFGLTQVNMVADTGYHFTATSGSGLYKGPISGRNDALDFTRNQPKVIVNNAVNDVAMTVLPNAPIDPATGLPVPTIAVATDGGVSVIKDDGNVWDITGSNWMLTARDLNFVGSDLYFTQNIYTVLAVDVTDLNSDLTGVADNSTTPPLRRVIPAGSYTTEFSERSLAIDSDTYTLARHVKRGNSSTDAWLNLTKENKDDFTKGMSAFVSADYNTGWMNGDIKGAFLSDTDDTDLVGSGELVTNGTDPIVATTGWVTRANAILSASGGDLVATTPAAGVSRVYQAISVEVGQTYRITWDVTLSGTGFIVALGTSVGGTQVFSTSAAVGDRYFVATTTTVYFEFGCTTASASDTYTLSSASAQLADADRSVNNNGLIVNGTVTRTPVATGADLVAYSGFSASNYLEQPYNSDLDFGTGDFCIMGWLSITGAAGYQMFFSRYGGSNIKWIFIRRDNANKIGFSTYNAAGNPTASLTSLTGLAVGKMYHYVAVRRASGVHELYINGILEASASATVVDMSVNAPVTVGGHNSVGQFVGSLALLRISATAPTAEQIAKIYNDEKVLFQENAQATLYGSSDAVTALAHDDATNLLHVGTSAGRSVFQGLRRVDNTTDAVGTAISAANNMIVEE